MAREKFKVRCTTRSPFTGRVGTKGWVPSETKAASIARKGARSGLFDRCCVFATEAPQHWSSKERQVRCFKGR